MAQTERIFTYMQLRGAGRDGSDLEHQLEGLSEVWRAAGHRLWGVWRGLFGVASNELLVVVAGAEPAAAALPGDSSGRVTLVDRLVLTPTARPADDTPCERPGLYVFRFFDVAGRDVDEVVALSRAAWTTFEASDAYATEPQGLFRQPGLAPDVVDRMLLVTWYDGFNSWLASRRPAPEAMDNFQRRRELTHGTRALATTLLSPANGPDLPDAAGGAGGTVAPTR